MPTSLPRLPTSWSIGDSGGKSAKQLNPFPPNVYHWYHALALYSAREYEQAIKVLREAQSSDHWSHALLATCYAQTDRMSEAHLEVRAFIRERGLELSERGETLPVNTLELARTCAARYRNPVDRDSRAYAA